MALKRTSSPKGNDRSPESQQVRKQWRKSYDAIFPSTYKYIGVYFRHLRAANSAVGGHPRYFVCHHYLFPIPMMFQMKYDCDRPSGWGIIHVHRHTHTDRQTTAR